MADSKTLLDKIKEIRRDGGKTGDYTGMDEVIKQFMMLRPSLGELGTLSYELAMMARQQAAHLKGIHRKRILELALTYATHSIAQARGDGDEIGEGYGAVLAAEILPELGRTSEAITSLRDALAKADRLAPNVADADIGRFDNLRMNLLLWLLYYCCVEGSTSRKEVLDWLSALGANDVFNKKKTVNPQLFLRELAMAALFLAQQA